MALYDTAADWVLRIEAEPETLVSPAFEAWLYAHPDHVRAYNDVANTWTASPSIVAEGLGPLAEKPRAERRIWLWGSVAGAGSAIAASLVLGWSLQMVGHVEDSPGLRQDYATALGEISPYELADATRLILDTDSRAHVNYSNRAREVYLSQGQVFVDVTHNPERPFTVEAQDYRFTALGTAYAVAYERQGLRLEVYEGVVEMQGARFGTSRIEAGNGIHITPDRVARFDLHAHLSSEQPDWTQSRVILDEMSVGDAVDVFARYSPITITIEGEALRAHKVSGSFDLTDIEGFIETLAFVTGAELDEVSESQWILRR